MKSGKPIVVTGATSFIGSHVVALLLARDYVVRGTTRNLLSPRVKALTSLPNSHKLTIVEADMLEPETFPSFLNNAQALIHIATPVIIGPDGVQPFKTVEEGVERQVKPAVDGTRALFHAAAEAGVKRIVLTSSAIAMSVLPVQPPVLDETYWSDEDLVRKKLMDVPDGMYTLSKLLQERLAWKLAEELGLKLLVINPGYVFGPVILPSSCDSLDLVANLAKGKGLSKHPCQEGMVPNKLLRFVDVREVAEGHVLALESDDAEGRYMMISFYKHCEEIYKVLHEHQAFKKFPERQVDTSQRLNTPPALDNSKVRKLGVKEIPWEETIRATAESLASTKSI
ncbi:cinnamoyl-CoA reductase [Gracilaria domingensis]|nr:cinnamoyl-CoA reductase [Gracilaria domingensis]